MAWRRCGSSPFYKDLDEGPTQFHTAFLDPVDLVLIRTKPLSGGGALLWRMQLLDFAIEAVPQHFAERTARRIDAWFERISDQAEQAAIGFKTAMLADLDVDEAERDDLLDSLKVMVDLRIGRTDVARVNLPRSLGEIEKTLRSYGVPAC